MHAITQSARESSAAGNQQMASQRYSRGFLPASPLPSAFSLSFQPRGLGVAEPEQTNQLHDGVRNTMHLSNRVCRSDERDLCEAIIASQIKAKPTIRNTLQHRHGA